MMSRNNEKEKIIKAAERRDRFAIRKLTVGAASVLLGTSLWLGANNTVAKADVKTDSANGSDSSVATESQQAVNTGKVDKVVVESNTTPPPTDTGEQKVNVTNSNNDSNISVSTESDETTDNSQVQATTQNQAASQKSESNTQSQTQSPAKQEQAVKQEQTQSNTQAQPQDQKQTQAQTSSAAEQKTSSETKEQKAEKAVSDAQKQATAPVKQDAKDTTTDADQVERTIKITDIDDSTGQTLYGSTTFKAKTGDSKNQIRTGYVGYKLMNPEALEGLQVESPAYGHANLVVPDHDVDLTLHFLPLAPTEVDYVDTDGKVLTKFSEPSDASTSKSPYSDQDGIVDSRVLARAIDIPGYELVFDPTIEKPITQVSTKDNLNRMILKFVYKKIDDTADKGLPNGGGAGITGLGEDYGINWADLPGGVSIDLTKDTYGDNHFEETIKNMQDRYTKQGFSYIGILNGHVDTDKTNRLESYISVHFLPHKSVTVNYVDENGNKLSDPVELSFNKDNPDQANNGIDPKQNWYPSGEWKSEAKDINGYALDRVLGATEGKFTTFKYTVTYVYAKKTIGQVIYVDETDNKTLQNDALNGKVGGTVTYDPTANIGNYEKQGYVLVSNDFANGAKTFDEDAAKNVFKIVFKHGITTNTVSKDGSEVIHYVYEDGKKAADDNSQTTTFTQTVKTDAVTGKEIESSWTPENHTFNKVDSPEIENYHADKTSVDGATVTPDNPSIVVTVTYAKNGTKTENTDSKKSTQTIKFVDENGNELAKATVSPVFNYEYSGDTYDAYTNKLIKKGSWNADSHTFDVVDVPVIDGYVAVKGFDKKDGKVVAGGLTSTRDNLDVVGEVIYQKIGKIVPVDPKDTPIPDAPTPGYKNDPQDPTKVTPNEPVPDIPDYTPKTPTVTPKDPTKDTRVPYDRNPEVVNGDVIYIDDTTGDTLKTDKLSGKVGDKIDYTTKDKITDFENKGYVLKTNEFKDGDEVFAETGNEFKVHFVHGTVPVTPDKPGKPGEPIDPNNPDGPKWPEGTDENSVKKTGSQTIHYVGAGNKTPKDDVQEFTFTKNMVVDKVTGKVIDTGTWNVTSHTFGNVDTPIVDGYHADKRNAGGTTITPDDLKKTVTVTYTANGKIIPVDPSGKPIPNAPTPIYPTDPKDPTKVVSDEPVPTVPDYTPSQKTVTPKDPDKDTPVVYNPKTNPVAPDSPDSPNPTPDVPTPSKPDNNKPTPDNPSTPVPHGETTPTVPETPNNNNVPVAPKGQDTPAPAPHGEAPEVPNIPTVLVPHATNARGGNGNNRGNIVNGPVKGNTVVSTSSSEGGNIVVDTSSELPQTGEETDPAAAILGATAGLIGMVGLLGIKNKKEY